MHIRHQFPTKYTIRQDDKDWILQEVEEERDLGIITTADFKVSRQCAEAASKANKVLGMVSSQFKDLDKEGFCMTTLRICHASLVTIFDRSGDVNHLEKDQRRATRLVKGFKKLQYEERLRKLGLTTLQQRRL